MMMTKTTTILTSLPARAASLTIAFVCAVVSSSDLRFTRSVYEVNISENVKYSEPLLTLSAVLSPADLARHQQSIDASSNNIYYGLAILSDSESGDGLDIFHLNERDGTLSLVRDDLIDFEKRKSYRMQITARTRLPRPAYAFAELLVSVQDQNDNAPCISIMSWNDGITTIWSTNNNQNNNTNNKYELIENHALELAIIQVHDRDSGENAHANLFVNDSRFDIRLLERFPHSSVFAMDITNPIDRESEPFVFLKLTAIDNGDPVELSNHVDLVINILDQNDSPPQFEHNVIYAKIAENNAPNSRVLDLAASDPDLIGGPIAYLIANDDDDNNNREFYVDPHNGTVYALKSFDREQKSHYELNVTAVDTNSGASSTVLVEIEIEDENDNPPLFASLQNNFDIAPPLGDLIGRVVGQLTVRDIDQGRNAEMSIEISPSIFSHCFALTSSTNNNNRNLIYFKSNCVNWNRTRDIHLTLIARNRHSAIFESHANVSIRVNQSLREIPLPVLVNVTNSLTPPTTLIDMRQWQAIWCDPALRNHAPLIAWIHSQNCESAGCGGGYKPKSPSDQFDLFIDSSNRIFARNMQSLQKIVNASSLLLIQTIHSPGTVLECRFLTQKSYSSRHNQTEIILYAIPGLTLLLAALILSAALRFRRNTNPRKKLKTFENEESGSSRATTYDNYTTTDSDPTKSVSCTPVCSSIAVPHNSSNIRGQLSESAANNGVAATNVCFGQLTPYDRRNFANGTDLRTIISSHPRNKAFVSKEQIV